MTRLQKNIEIRLSDTDLMEALYYRVMVAFNLPTDTTLNREGEWEAAGRVIRPASPRERDIFKSLYALERKLSPDDVLDRWFLIL